MKVGENLAHFHGETGELFIFFPRNPEHRGVKGAQAAAEIVLSSEGPGFKGEGDGLAAGFEDELRRGRRPSGEDGLGIPLFEKIGPGQSPGIACPNLVRDAAGEPVLDAAEPRMGRDDDRSAPAFGMDRHGVKREPPAERITGENGIPLPRAQ